MKKLLLRIKLIFQKNHQKIPLMMFNNNQKKEKNQNLVHLIKLNFNHLFFNENLQKKEMVMIIKYLKMII